MRGRRLGVNEHGNRPAIEGMVIGKQHVKYERGSRVYFTESYGAVNKSIPVNPHDLDGDRLYDARFGYTNGRGALKRYEGERMGPMAIETLVAQFVPELQDGQVLCVRDVAPKPYVAKGKGKTKLLNARKASVLRGNN